MKGQVRFIVVTVERLVKDRLGQIWFVYVRLGKVRLGQVRLELGYVPSTAESLTQKNSANEENMTNYDKLGKRSKNKIPSGF